MKIIKNRQIVENDYRFLADDEAFDIDEKIVVSVARWLAEKEQLLASVESGVGKDFIGIRLNVEDDLEAIAEDLKTLALVEFNFAAFTDGRSFSRAKLLKDRFDYQGEMRAVGNFMVDQVCYLSKVGFQSFQLSDESKLPTALKTLDDFSESYQ